MLFDFKEWIWNGFKRLVIRLNEDEDEAYGDDGVAKLNKRAKRKRKI